MTRTFGRFYAEAYDALYAEKDYEAECDLVERLFATYSSRGVETILDLGCGTGNHAILLSRRGYDVVGVDRSEEMITRARAKAEELTSFHVADLRDARLGREFDAALMLFAVLGYQTENRDVLAALETARAHLRPGGLVVFDVWFGPAVICEGPSPRVRMVTAGGSKTLRVATAELDVIRQVCSVDFRLWGIEDDRLVADVSERHEMRFFFPCEIDAFLERAGFRLLRLGAFPEVDHEPDLTSWNVIAVAEAVDGISPVRR